MEYCRKITSVMCACITLSPVMQGADDQNPWIVAAAVAISATVGAVGGALGMRASYESESFKAQELEKEKKVVSAAEVTLNRIQKEAHPILQHTIPPSYEDFAKLNPGHELSHVRNQLSDFHTHVQQQKEKLSVIIGKYSPDKEDYVKAHGLHQQFVQYEQKIIQCEGLLRALDDYKNEPLQGMRGMVATIQRLQSTSHTRPQVIESAIRHYADATTHDGIKNLPLVCAVETLSEQRALVEKWQRNLEAHRRSLKTRDVAVETALAELNTWRDLLQNAAQVIAQDSNYSAQVAANNAAKIARLNAQTEHAHERAKLAQAEKDLQHEKNKAQERENERARLAIEQQQAATNLAHSIANAAHSTVTAIKETEQAREKEREQEQAREEARKLFCGFHRLDSRYCPGNACYCSDHHCYKDRCPHRYCPVHQR